MEAPNPYVHIYNIQQKQDLLDSVVNSMVEKLLKSIEDHKASAFAILFALFFILFLLLIKKNLIRFLQSVCKKKPVTNQNPNQTCNIQIENHQTESDRNVYE
jgi:hypothetical protein